jgi:translation initiation factor IF-3
MRGKRPLVQPDAHRINEFIQAKEVRVISPTGEQLGVLPIGVALAKAQEFELDLVEVSGQAKPPVCKILDYGKFKYKEQKKEAEAKKEADAKKATEKVEADKAEAAKAEAAKADPAASVKKAEAAPESKATDEPKKKKDKRSE